MGERDQPGPQPLLAADAPAVAEDVFEYAEDDVGGQVRVASGREDAQPGDGVAGGGVDHDHVGDSVGRYRREHVLNKVAFSVQDEAATAVADVGRDQVGEQARLPRAGRPADERVAEPAYGRLRERASVRLRPGGDAQQPSGGGESAVGWQQRAGAQLEAGHKRRSDRPTDQPSELARGEQVAAPWPPPQGVLHTARSQATHPQAAVRPAA